MLMLDVAKLCGEIANRSVFSTVGRLHGATGLLWSCSLPGAVGDLCHLQTPRGAVPCEIIGFNKGWTYIVPYETGFETQAGMAVVHSGHGLRVPVGEELLGRILDGIGRPLDQAGPVSVLTWRPILHESPPALSRNRINEPLVTGQRAIDGLLTLGWGQRVGIFSGSGVGKSTLLGEIAKGSNADVNVIALIGERGREVRPFIEDCLGDVGMRKSVVVIATSDQTPLMRIRAAHTAITIGDHFRQSGAKVLLMLDSLTRLAMAQRELGLALGEPPTARGYTPSVFQLLANIIERMGNDGVGSLTGILTVLVDGGDMDEPVSDAVRGLVDGHFVLSRSLAERGHYPAIDIGRSLSRVAHEVTAPEHAAAARRLRALLAIYAEAEDLLRIGAYVKGSSPQIDRAVEMRPAVLAFLQQQIGQSVQFAQTVAETLRLAGNWPF
jgi:flagellum-specific ATP synthase